MPKLSLKNDRDILLQEKRIRCSFGIFIAWWYVLISRCNKVILTCWDVAAEGGDDDDGDDGDVCVFKETGCDV